MTQAAIGTETIRGTICKVHYGSATFSAGILETDERQFVRFRGKFHANEGDYVALTGQWRNDPKWGMQFDVDSVSYDLPETEEGLIRYLADHPAFHGIGEVTARKIVACAKTGDNLEKLLTEDLDGFASAVRVPRKTLETLRDAWQRNAAENRVRTFLSAYDLSSKQQDKLLERFGEAIVGILKSDPYQIIRLVDGYGFKRADEIARKMGIAKDHPGRISAGIMYCIGEEVSAGHTWTSRDDLLTLANNLLVLDGLDSLDVIRARIEDLEASGDIVTGGGRDSPAEDQALAIPAILDAERLIRDTLETHAWRERTITPTIGNDHGLAEGQLSAYRNALRYRVSTISGGAGTGKTYVVARLAGAMLASGLKVALCAPTGKAAKRIEELLSRHGVNIKAHTIHRLLAYDGTSFRRGSLSLPFERMSQEGIMSEPAYDAVLIDEFSMVDVPLFAELLRRVDFDRTRLVLIGDHNQLPPVGPGNVLRDILAYRMVPATILDKVHRQAGILKTNSCRILGGVVAPSAGADNGWIVIDGFREPEAIQTFLRDLVKTEIPRRFGYDPLRDIQVITPTHKGPLGTKELNNLFQYLFRGKPTGRFVTGDKVIQTANDYKLGVMNGTIGYVLGTTEKGYVIEFDGEGQKIIENEEVHNVHLAYALTGHKCQGSEFPCAVVICHKSHFFADRNWLYTAVTRAAKTCILVGDKWGLANAAKKNQTISRRTLLSLWGNRRREITR